MGKPPARPNWKRNALQKVMAKYHLSNKTDEDRKSALKAVYRLNKRCPGLAQLEAEFNFVPGTGRMRPWMMVIGDAPARHEDAQGRPFVGSAGHILDGALSCIQVPRKKLFITNAVKFRPPISRTVSYREEEYSMEFLVPEIEIVAPLMIVTFGRHSLNMLTNSMERVPEAHGTLKEFRGIPLVPMHSPIDTLYADDIAREFKEDFKTIKELLCSLRG